MLIVVITFENRFGIIIFKSKNDLLLIKRIFFVLSFTGLHIFDPYFNYNNRTVKLQCRRPKS